jgi:hypothetical protein
LIVFLNRKAIVSQSDCVASDLLWRNLILGMLAHIWSLADIHQRGKLDHQEFAVAMWLIHQRLQGKDIPSTLPLELVLNVKNRCHLQLEIWLLFQILQNHKL